MIVGIEAQRILGARKHGMDIVALELIRQIQKLDTTNQYILFARQGSDVSCVTETPHFRKKIIPGFSYADWEQIALPLAVKREKADLLHCTANTAPLRSPVPFVLTLHDIIYLEETNFKGSAYQNFGNIYRRYIVPRVIKKAKQVITVSDYEKKIILAKCQLPEERITVIHNAVDNRFRALPAADIQLFRKQQALPEAFILFLGNTAPKKNTTNTIRAYLQYCLHTTDPLPLVVTDYSKVQADKIISAWGKPPASARLVFPGYVAPDQMPLLYNAASLFLYTSVRESFGLPILEAMSCSVPVITSNTSAMPEIAGNAALFTDPANYKDMAQKIHQMLEDRELREKYIAKGADRVLQFSWEASAKKLLQVYNTSSNL